MTDHPKSTFAKRVRAAKPRAREYYVWDDVISGLGLRVGTSGHREGRCQYSLITLWWAACADAGLGRLRLSDLRHTAASQAVMSGENLPLVSKLLGHRRHRTTASYAHLADDHLVEAVEKIGNIITAAMSDQPSK